MEITLNGKRDERFGEPLPVALLLEKLGLKGKPVLVELNGTALRPREFEEAEVRDNAIIEIIQVAAGG